MEITGKMPNLQDFNLLSENLHQYERKSDAMSSFHVG